MNVLTKHAIERDREHLCRRITYFERTMIDDAVPIGRARWAVLMDARVMVVDLTPRGSVTALVNQANDNDLSAYGQALWWRERANAQPPEGELTLTVNGHTVRFNLTLDASGYYRLSADLCARCDDVAGFVPRWETDPIAWVERIISAVEVSDVAGG